MLSRVPFFIEVVSSAQHANVQICRKMMAVLFKEKIAPLPFASTSKEVVDVLSALKARGVAPAVFVVNTFFADELLPQVDFLIGTTPTVYLRRQIFAESLATKSAANGAAQPSLTLILQKMTPRLSAEWTYGSVTAEEVAAKGAKSLIRFLNEGNFAALEDFAQEQTLEMLRSRLDVGEGPARYGGGMGLRPFGRPKSGPISVPPTAPGKGGSPPSPPSGMINGSVGPLSAVG